MSSMAENSISALNMENTGLTQENISDMGDINSLVDNELTNSGNGSQHDFTGFKQ